MVKVTTPDNDAINFKRPQRVLVARTYRGNPVVRRFAVPFQPNTALQLQRREVFQFLSTSWLHASDTDRDTWDFGPEAGDNPPLIEYLSFNLTQFAPGIISPVFPSNPQDPPRDVNEFDTASFVPTGDEVAFLIDWGDPNPNIWGVLCFAVPQGEGEPSEDDYGALIAIATAEDEQTFIALAKHPTDGYNFYASPLSYDGIKVQPVQLFE